MSCEPLDVGEVDNELRYRSDHLGDGGEYVVVNLVRRKERIEHGHVGRHSPRGGSVEDIRNGRTVCSASGTGTMSAVCVAFIGSISSGMHVGLRVGRAVSCAWLRSPKDSCDPGTNNPNRCDANNCATTLVANDHTRLRNRVEAESVGDGGGLAAVGDAELGEDVGYVYTRGLFADV